MKVRPEGRHVSRGLLAVSLGLLLCASPAAAVSWSLGTQLDIAYVTSGPEGEGTSTVVTWPANALTYEPGLRLAVGNERHTRDATLDFGWFVLDEAGSTLSLFVASASYQHVFRPEWAWSPFADAGLGVYREDTSVQSHASTRYGGGIGMRHVVREDHGALRLEVHYDHLQANTETGRPKLDTWGLRFGFDLWL